MSTQELVADRSNSPQSAISRTDSLLGLLASLPTDQAKRFIESLTPNEALVLNHSWEFHARPAQLPPSGGWLTWIIEAGRGFGKTRPGAEWVIKQAQEHPGCRIALGGETPDDYRDTMIEGESGILSCAPPWFKPKFQASMRRVTFPNKSMAVCFSGETPNKLRGPQHHFAWIDEICKFRHPQKFLDMLFLGLRLGPDPRLCVTTTPRPIPAYLKLRKSADTVITGGTTYENLANLAPPFRKKILSMYENTRLGRQELLAQLMFDVPGALWKRDRIDELRVEEPPELQRIMVAVDPAITAEEDSDETGMVVGGVNAARHGFLLEDCSGHYSPAQWGEKAVRKFVQYGANAIIAEKNQGGDMVEFTIKTAAEKLSKEYNRELVVPVHLVTASKGKVARAEPVAALSEQGRLHHVGTFGPLEDQLCTWLPGETSPDRLDALVWLFYGLLLDGPLQPGVYV